MNDINIERINELAKKKKECGLSAEETTEQRFLYDNYIKHIRKQVKTGLDQVKSTNNSPRCNCGDPHCNH